LPFEFLAGLLTRKDCQFWNLQGGPSRARWQTLASPQLKDSPLLSDAGLVPLASVIAQLDLVITVDTLAAHLAGALNVPCWLLLQHAADWRWMIDRADSPWYPSLRLFRQPVAGDWHGVIDRVSQELQTWVAERPYARAVA
jgi:ADP-heptose:LPS heptosyltransferase